VAENSIQCAVCKQIFDKECIKHWLEGNAHCSICKHPFEPEVVNRNLEQMLDRIRFNCKYCSQEFTFGQQRSHLIMCPAILVKECPFGCVGIHATVSSHMKQECEKQPRCPACHFKVYPKYQSLSLHTPSTSYESTQGHNCLRDNPTSEALLHSLRALQSRARQAVNTRPTVSEQELRRKLQEVESELVLYKGPIPDACKPTLNDMQLFTLLREENATEGMS